MNASVISPSQLHQVGRVVIQRIVVDVVNHHPTPSRPVDSLPFDDRSGPPHVRLGHLHPCPPIPASFVPGADRDRAHWEQVGRHLPGAERARLRCATTGILGIPARHRAELAFALSMGERGETEPANVLDHGPIVSSFAGTGTTLAVADLHGRDAIGIDLDPANELLYPRRYDEVKRSLFGVTPELPGQESLL